MKKEGNILYSYEVEDDGKICISVENERTGASDKRWLDDNGKLIERSFNEEDPEILEFMKREVSHSYDSKKESIIGDIRSCVIGFSTKEIPKVKKNKL